MRNRAGFTGHVGAVLFKAGPVFVRASSSPASLWQRLALDTAGL